MTMNLSQELESLLTSEPDKGTGDLQQAQVILGLLLIPDQAGMLSAFRTQHQPQPTQL